MAPSLHDRLLDAAGGNGTDADLRKLIAGGANVKGREGAGPLNWAVASGRLTTVQILLDAGASIDGSYPEHTPLMQAKTAEVARYLLERGAKTDGRESLRGDAMNFTIDRADDAEHARVLLDHGFRVEPRHLALAVGKARIAMLALLLDRGGDANTVHQGRTILRTALASSAAGELAILLVERGAAVVPDDLLVASQWHNGPVVALLLGKTTGDVTPSAEAAASRDSVELLRILIESDRIAQLGSPLRAAARRGATAFDFLLHCGADPRERDADGASALHAAARGGSIAILERCLAEGCTFDLDAKGRSALHHAALGDKTADMLRALVARGLHLEGRDAAGATPLATCAPNLNSPAYDTLLELGADRSTGEAIRNQKIAEDEAFVAQFR